MTRSLLRAGTASAVAVAMVSSCLLLGASPASANGNCVTYWASAWSGAPAAGGSGTAADPYLVGSETDLEEVRYCSSAHFRQISDITLTAADWEPIATFTGSYRGDSHTISGLTLTTAADDRGLFGTLDGAQVTQLTLSGVSINASNRVGALAGLATNGTLVSGVSVTGNVTGGTDVGGIIGKTDTKSLVRRVSGAATVAGTIYTGGLVGSNYESDVSEATFTGTVTGEDSTGGAVGYACTGALDQIATSGTITGSGTVGGIVGDVSCDASLTESAAEVTVTGTAYVGGAVGWAYDARVADVAVTANVTGSSTDVGGLVGSTRGQSTLRDLAATGTVTSTSNNVGGLSGRLQDPSTLSSSVADVSVSGRDQTGGAVGSSTGPVDSVEVSGDVSGRRYTGGLVGLQQNVTLSDSTASGDVTSNGFSAGGLLGALDQASLVDSHATGNVTQTGNARDTGGLIGTANSARVRRSSAIGTVVSNSNPAGGLVGAANSIIVERSFAAGAVTATDKAGGLIGYLSATDLRSSISDSYARGNVTGGTGMAGGLIGVTEADGGLDLGKVITHSYASGVVTATTAGGLVGSEGDPVEVAGVSFWNITVNPTLGGPGTSATTTQMQEKATYADVGWEIQSGGARSADEKIWGICVPADTQVGEGFPFLVWQNETNPCPQEPSAPTLNSVTGTDKALEVVASLGADGNSAITDVQYSLDGGAWTSTGGTSGSFTISGLTNGVTYAVRVRAVNALGESPASNEVSATPSATPAPEPTPTPTPDAKTSLTVKARSGARGVPIGRRTLLVRSVQTDGVITAAQAVCRWKGQRVGARTAARICGTQVTTPAQTLPTDMRASATGQRVRITASPSCSRGVRISVRIRAKAEGARAAAFSRSYRVDDGPATSCRLHANG